MRLQDKPMWNKRRDKLLEAFGSDISRVRGMGHFQRASYHGLPPQDALRARARAAGKAGGGWRRAAERYCFEHPVLLPSELLAGLTLAELKEARRDIKSANLFGVEPAAEVPPEQLIQTCFAWPRSRFAEPRCSVCPQEGACRTGLEKG
jgi:hypothetical protein